MGPAVLATLFFALSAVCGQKSAAAFGPASANFLRFGPALLLLGIWSHVWGVSGGSAFWVFVLSGAIGYGIGDVGLFQALPRIGTNLTILLIHCLAAPVAALGEYWWMGTLLSGGELFAGGVILAGVAVALFPGGSGKAKDRRWWAGVAAALVAMLGQAGGVVFSRRGFELAALAGENVDGASAAYQRLLGGVVVAGAFLWACRAWPKWAMFDRASDATPGWSRPPAWGWVLANGIVGPALGVACYQWALKGAPGGVVLPIVALTPLAVMPLSRYLGGERVGRRALAGSLIAVAGAVLLAFYRR